MVCSIFSGSKLQQHSPNRYHFVSIKIFPENQFLLITAAVFTFARSQHVQVANKLERPQARKRRTWSLHVRAEAIRFSDVDLELFLKSWSQTVSLHWVAFLIFIICIILFFKCQPESTFAAKSDALSQKSALIQEGVWLRLWAILMTIFSPVGRRQTRILKETGWTRYVKMRFRHSHNRLESFKPKKKQQHHRRCQHRRQT